MNMPACEKCRQIVALVFEGCCLHCLTVGQQQRWAQIEVALNAGRNVGCNAYSVALKALMVRAPPSTDAEGAGSNPANAIENVRVAE